MGDRDGLVMALVLLVPGVATQSGCASKLDFDQVSAGHHSREAGADTGVSAVDAGGLDAMPTADAASSFDAGRSVAASPSDAAAEASSVAEAATDAGKPPDAEVPDASLGSDPAMFSCATVSGAFFCDDFERFALSEQWDPVLVGPSAPLPGGSIAIDGIASRSGHNSLLVQVNEGVSACDECLYLVASRVLPELRGPTTVSVEFDLRVEQIDPTPTRRISLLRVLLGSEEIGYTQHTLGLESSGSSVRAAFIEQDTEAAAPASTAAPAVMVWQHDFAPKPALGQWVHVKYVLDTDSFVTLTIDGSALFDNPLQYALRSTGGHLEIGVPWVDMTQFTEQDTSKTWRVRYDNVLVRREPR